MTAPSSPVRARVVSGMRPTGQLHLGHLVGALGNWVPLQDAYDCFYFVADWHALTSDYANTGQLTTYAYEMAADWLAAGLDPEKSTLFVQSLVPEHAELYLLLSMVVPVPWLEPQDVAEAVLMTSRGGTRYQRTFLEGFIRPGPDAGNWASRAGLSALGVIATYGAFVIRRADRLLFGTDYLAPGQVVPQVDLYRKLDLPDDIREKVFRGNARRLLGLH